MTCDLCGKKEATVHLTEIINEESRELHLCESCAREKGPPEIQDFALAGLLAGLADFGTKLEERAPGRLACPQCKMTYEDFRKLGRLGCGRCYETFRRYLAPLLKRIHGSTQHIGKRPELGKAPALSGEAKGTEPPAEELSQLKEQLAKAVASEQFEEAARLRDRIRVLEAKLKKKPAKG